MQEAQKFLPDQKVLPCRVNLVRSGISVFDNDFSNGNKSAEYSILDIFRETNKEFVIFVKSL